MTSILTNNSAMNALNSLRNINNNLGNTQDRISSGLKVASGKDNAAYFTISQIMNSDSSLNKSVNESMTIAKNSIATARLGVEAVVELAKQYLDRQSFAQNLPADDQAAVTAELTNLVTQMQNIVSQANFNGEDLLTDEAPAAKTVVTGIYRNDEGEATASVVSLTTVDVNELIDDLGAAFTAASIQESREALADMVNYATALGIAEKAIENQQSFLTSLTDRLDSGIGGMIDADMEQEAARLQALQVQQQLATQALSIANQSPQNILSLFR
ncbi:MAG: flagellin N-terminal helical domain-containing protein [Roseinatronobacter sp.]